MDLFFFPFFAFFLGRVVYVSNKRIVLYSKRVLFSSRRGRQKRQRTVRGSEEKRGSGESKKKKKKGRREEEEFELKDGGRQKTRMHIQTINRRANEKRQMQGKKKKENNLKIL